MKIEPKNCSDCPFHHHSYDDYALGDGNNHVCSLQEFMMEINGIGYNPAIKNATYFLDTTPKGKIKLPKWCPIKDDTLSIKLNTKQP